MTFATISVKQLQTLVEGCVRCQERHDALIIRTELGMDGVHIYAHGLEGQHAHQLMTWFALNAIGPHHLRDKLDGMAADAGATRKPEAEAS